MTILKKVRIMVAIDPDGNWSAMGWEKATEDELKEIVAENIANGENYYWVTAMIEIPKIKEVDATDTKYIPANAEKRDLGNKQSAPNFVEVFDSDGNVIPEMIDILVRMETDKILSTKTYKEYPFWQSYHWVDNGTPVKRIPFGIAEKYRYEEPQAKQLPYFVSIFDDDGNVIPGAEAVLNRMAKNRIVELVLLDQHPLLGNIMWYHWVDSGKPVESIPIGIAKLYGYGEPDMDILSASDPQARPIIPNIIPDVDVETT